MIYLIAYSIFCIAFAKMNAIWIKANKRIYHGINGAIHIAAAVAGWYFFGWQIGVSILFAARLVFDTALNLFRGLAIDYIPAKPKSIVDRIEKRLFRNDGLTPKLVYLSIIVLIQFL